MNQPADYTERYRPQFHFTAKTNWLNDPNGCVFHAGEYHLFFQHNPDGRDWGNMTWGHAVSPDLVHWQQLAHAIRPYDGGTIYSGTAVVDAANTSGLGEAGHGPLVAAFTHARAPFGQALAFSLDRGRTWTLVADGTHVVPNQGLDEGERDPKVFWHEPSDRWVMVLWVKKGGVRFFTSANLLEWTHASDFTGSGFYECPDLVPLPLDGEAQNTKWVLYDAALSYWIGRFDGTTFTAEAGPLQGDYGAHFYAAQTWNGTGSRKVQIGWMRGGEYPEMPFNQQMSFPCELALRTTAAGVRLCRLPIAEIESLRGVSDSAADVVLRAGQDLSLGEPGDLFDIEAVIEMDPDAGFVLQVYDQAIACGNGKLVCLGQEAPLADGCVHLRILVDRTSIEIFANHGEICMSSCFLPAAQETTVRCRVSRGQIRIRSLVVHPLLSAWAGVP